MKSFISIHATRSPLWSGLAVIVLAALTATAMAQAPVATVAVRQQAMDARFDMDGVVQAVRQSTLSAQASGRIASLRVKAGDQVKSGQLLATIDDREAAVDLKKSQAQTNQAEADWTNARAQFERTRDLQSKGFVSKAALDVAQAQLKSAQAQRDQADASMRQSHLSRTYTQVTAPFAGWILQTQAEAGDLAVPGKPLLTLYAPLPLRVVVQVPASRTQSARDASAVQILVGSATGGVQDRITPTGQTVVPSSDPVSQTTEWRLDLPVDKSAALVPGQQVRVRFASPKAAPSSALRVPEGAIVRRGELTGVYVASGKGFALRAVRLGRSDGDAVEVLAGLREGDAVALNPLAAAQVGATPAAPVAAPTTQTQP